jgi:ketosteroid isomerase-like protein
VPAEASQTARDEVIAMEKRRTDALVAGDVAAMAELIADDFVYIHSNSEIDDRESYLTLFGSGKLKYRRFEHRGIRVRQFGDVVILNALTELEVPREPSPMTLRVRSTSTWARLDGRWRQVLWHATLLREKNGT